MLDSINILKNIKNNKIERNQNKFKTQLLSKPLVNNKSHFHQLDKLNNNNIINDFFNKKLDYKSFKEKIHFFERNKTDVEFINNEINEKKNTFFTDVKDYKNNSLLSKNINKITNIIRTSCIFKDINKKENIKSHVEPLVLHNSKNSLEWKKSISQKILFSISHKNNQVEMYLKPEYLGSIYIRINMKNDEATLNFFSHNKDVRMFLDNSINFLRSSLIKNGIKLQKYNIYNSLKKQELNNYKSLLDKNVFNINQLKNKLNLYKKNSEMVKDKIIDIYV